MILSLLLFCYLMMMGPVVGVGVGVGVGVVVVDSVAGSLSLKG